MKNFKKKFALLLAFVMVLSMMPMITLNAQAPVGRVTNPLIVITHGNTTIPATTAFINIHFPASIFNMAPSGAAVRLVIENASDPTHLSFISVSNFFGTGTPGALITGPVDDVINYPTLITGTMDAMGVNIFRADAALPVFPNSEVIVFVDMEITDIRAVINARLEFFYPANPNAVINTVTLVTNENVVKYINIITTAGVTFDHSAILINEADDIILNPILITERHRGSFDVFENSTFNLHLHAPPGYTWSSASDGLAISSPNMTRNENYMYVNFIQYTDGGHTLILSVNTGQWNHTPAGMSMLGQIGISGLSLVRNLNTTPLQQLYIDMDITGTTVGGLPNIEPGTGRWYVYVYTN